MYISRIRVENFRRFHGSRTVDLDLRRADGSYAGWTVIAGRNGSGKSSLLRAVALAVAGPAVARNLIPDFSNWISSDQLQATVDVEVLQDDDYEWFVGGGRAPVGTFWAGLQWHTPDQDLTPSRRGFGAQPTMEERFFRSPRTARRGRWQDNPPTGWFLAAYGPFRRLVGGSGDAQRLLSAALAVLGDGLLPMSTRSSGSIPTASG